MENRNAEKGYLLILISFVAIAIAGMFLSITYYYTNIIKQNHFYAFGQELAQIANASHYYVQWQQMNKDTWGVDYEADATLSRVIDISAELQGTSGFLPDSLVPFPIKSVAATVIGIRGTLGPKNMLDEARGATAYLLVNFTYPADGAPSPSDMNALIAGASNEGLLVGVPKSPKLFGIASDNASTVSNAQRDDCYNASGAGGVAVPEKAWVTWADGPYDCMSAGDIDAVFGAGTANSMHYYDLIIPAWTVAQSKQDIRAVYRLKQPGLPMAQTLQVDIDMANKNIGDGSGVGPGGQDVLEIQTDYIHTVDADIGGETYVADAAAGGSGFAGDVEATGNLSYTDEMGAVNLTATNADPDTAGVPTLSVGGDMFVSAGDTVIDTDIGTQNVLDVGSLITDSGAGNPMSNTMTVTGVLTGEEPGNNLAVNVNQPGFSQTFEVEEMDMAPNAAINVSGTGGNVVASNIDFSATETSSENLGAEDVSIEPATNDAANDLIITGEVNALSLEVLPSSPGTGPSYGGTITGIGSEDAYNQCYGACPDIELPPDTDPFD